MRVDRYGTSQARAKHHEKLDGQSATEPRPVPKPPQSENNSAPVEADLCPTASPVIISSGEKILPETDASSAGLYGMALDRTYRSINTTGYLFGPNWASSLDPVRVTKSTLPCISTEVGCIPRDATVTFPDGTKYKYTWMPSSPGEYQVNGNAAMGTLSGGVTPSSGWGLSMGTKYYSFSSVGRQTAFNDSAGEALTQTWNGYQLTRVTSRVGKTFNFTWASGRVSQVTDPAGGVWNYGYNANGMLSTVTSPGSSPDIRSYHYENTDPTLLTGVSINGVRYSTYSYFADKRVQVSGLAGGEERDTFSYGSNATTVINAAGQATTYNFIGLPGSRKVSSVSRRRLPLVRRQQQARFMTATAMSTTRSTGTTSRLTTATTPVVGSRKLWGQPTPPPPAL